MAADSSKFSFRYIRDVEDDLLQDFNCGRTQLDEFLRNDARDYDQHGLTASVIVFTDNSPSPIAYFSLSADAVRLSEGERTDLGLPFDTSISYYPAVKITKLAVASDWQNTGIGSSLINLICGLVSEAPFAVRLLTTDAVNQEKVINFYRDTGFLESLSEEKQHKQQTKRETILMYKDLYQ